MIKRNVFTFKCKSRRANNDCFCTNFGRNDGLIMSQTFKDASMVNLYNKNIYPAYLKGATGATGNTGATGPAGGGEIIAGQTVTIEPGEDAMVTATHQGDKTYLNFFIPKGSNGYSEKVKVGFVVTAEPEDGALVTDRIIDEMHYLDFQIPRGDTGARGEQGMQGERGEQGIKGDTGPQGERGPQGEQGERGEAGTQGEQGFPGERGQKGEKGDKGDPGERGPQGLQGEVGPQGVQGQPGERGPAGPTGPTGAVETIGAMIVSYTDPQTFSVDGQEIASNARLPLSRLELNHGSAVTLDNANNTLKFTKTGVYKFTFSINAYVKKTGADFSHETDFVAVAFRAVGTDDVYGAVNSWSNSETASNMFGQGMLTVADTEKEYELVNVQKKSIYIVGANITQTLSNSYFAVPMVSLVITKL